MKKIRLILAIVLLAVASLLGFSREPGLKLDPVFKDGKVWEIRSVLVNKSEMPTFSRVVTGDTIVNNRFCKKLERLENGEIVPNSAQIWYEEDNRIYSNTSSPDRLYYDLGADVGDEYPWMKSDVLEVRHVTVCGVERRVVEFYRTYRENLEDRDYWIEGVGPVYGSVCAGLPRPGFSDLLHHEIVACYEDGRKIFDLEEFEQTMKEILAIEGVECDVDDSNEPVYDLFGRRVAKPVPGQIYISKGKKFVVTE